MAVNPVTLAETLRPWRIAGIDAFLVKEFFPHETLAEKNFFNRVEITFPQSSPASSDTLVCDAALRPPALTCAQHVATKKSPLQDAKDITRLAQKPTQASVTSSLPKLRPISPNPSAWPPAWQKIFAKTKPAPIVWTYAELGEDLTGSGSKERSACLRSLIGGLSLPRGSSAFWPVTLPPASCSDMPLANKKTGTELQNAGWIFQEGLQLLHPNVLIFLGLEATMLSGLSFAPRPPFSQLIHQGILCVLLPCFDDLLTKKEGPKRTKDFIRSLLATVSPLFHHR